MRRPARIESLVATGVALAVLGGCYERVVRAEGPTAYKYDVYESNLTDDGLANDLADVVLGDGNSSGGKKKKK